MNNQLEGPGDNRGLPRSPAGALLVLAAVAALAGACSSDNQAGEVDIQLEQRADEATEPDEVEIQLEERADEATELDEPDEAATASAAGRGGASAYVTISHGYIGDLVFNLAVLAPNGDLLCNTNGLRPDDDYASDTFFDITLELTDCTHWPPGPDQKWCFLVHDEAEEDEGSFDWELYDPDGALHGERLDNQIRDFEYTESCFG